MMSVILLTVTFVCVYVCVRERKRERSVCERENCVFVCVGEKKREVCVKEREKERCVWKRERKSSERERSVCVREGCVRVCVWERERGACVWERDKCVRVREKSVCVCVCVCACVCVYVCMFLLCWLSLLKVSWRGTLCFTVGDAEALRMSPPPSFLVKKSFQHWAILCPQILAQHHFANLPLRRHLFDLTPFSLWSV